MHSHKRSSKCAQLAALAVTAALGVSACGPDYTYFRVHVTAAGIQADRDPIDHCYMTIMDSSNKDVVKQWRLQATYASDPDGNPVIDQGCGPNMTKSSVGNFSYSTSRTSGSLVFKVDAVDANNVPVQGGTSDARGIPCPKEFIASEDGTCRVDVAMSKVGS
jgi:hypothetical protein